MRRSTCLGFLVVVGWITGCAHVEVTRVMSTDTRIPTPTETNRHPVDPHGEGVYFYRPAFYLSVTKDDKGAFKYDVIKLPDVSQEYRVTFHQGWGTLDASVGLTDGWSLASLGSKTDSKGPETITAIGSLLTAGIKGFEFKPTTDGSVPVGFYQIRFEGGSIKLHRVEAVLE